jgi:hypothetical protein
MQSEIAIGRIVKVREHPQYNSVYLYGRIQRTTSQFYVIDIEFKDTPNLNGDETRLYDVIPHHVVKRVNKRIATDVAKYNMTILENYPHVQSVHAMEYEQVSGDVDITAYHTLLSTLFNLLESANVEEIQQIHASTVFMDRLRMIVHIAESTGIPLSSTHPVYNILATHAKSCSDSAKVKLIELCDELKTTNKMSEVEYERVVRFVNEGKIHSVLDVFEDMNDKQTILEGDYLRACNAMRDIELL